MIAVTLFWISLVITIAGVWVGISVVRLAKGGVLASMSWWLLVGIVMFAIHHFMEISLRGELVHELSEIIEQFTSIAFLVGAVVLTLTVRSMAAKPTGSE